MRMFRSTRFRLTLWHTFVLALVLLIFSSIVFEVVSNHLNAAVYTHLSSRLVLSDLFSVLAITLPFMLLLSLASGYWLAGRAMRPVRTITRAAQLISETDLHRRLRLKQRDELGELAATFDRMLDRLEAAFARQRQFTADASHELRTPLSIIDLEATRALARELSAREYHQAITTIQQENRHMTRLVDDLLVLARADAGHAKLRYEQIDLGEVVIDTVERLAPLAQKTSMVIKVAPLPELALLGDRVYLMQLLTNIIENALKYGSTTGTSVEIELVSLHRQGKAWAMLRVRDDGAGIAKEHLPHLFERFYRVDSSRTRSQETAAGVSGTSDTSGPFAPAEQSAGNGLGLSIAQWIAQAHGGEIQVRSAPGRETAFEIWLPVYSAENARKENFSDKHMSRTATEMKHKEKTHMSQRMDFREGNSEEPSAYYAGNEGTPSYYSYATGFGATNAGQKLSGAAHSGRELSASHRLALAIVSLVLWVFTLFGLVILAIAFHADASAGVYVFLLMMLFSGLIAVVNFVFNRK